MPASEKTTEPRSLEDSADERARASRYRALQTPVPPEAIEWRLDGRPREFTRGDKQVPFARFVAYITAQFVQKRLDEHFCGEWNLSLQHLGMASDKDGVATCIYKASLTVGGLTREDVGEGDSHKSAATDAFKRAAVRFGIARELYEMGQNWVPVTDLGKLPKAAVDPGEYYAKHSQARTKPTPAPDPAQGPAGRASTESTER